MTTKDRAQKVLELLSEEYPGADCTLEVYSPEWFLISNILSPQTTDVAVNVVMQELVKKFDSPTLLADADLSEIEEIIKPLGFYRNKSRYIKESAELLRDEFDGELSDDLVKLQKFKGIARKTALVILAVIYDRIEGIVIDTHNIRIPNRIGIVDEERPAKLELELQGLLPQTRWWDWSNLMVAHGREVCTSRSPECERCAVRGLCDWFAENR